MNYLKVLLIFVLFITDCYGVKDKFVSITLDAKWLDTPLHQEARYIYIYQYKKDSIEFVFSEFLATQNTQYFWSLINDVSSFDSFTPDARMRRRFFFLNIHMLFFD
jgi:hypothetical protein